jgi:ATP-dependent Lon protease
MTTNTNGPSSNTRSKNPKIEVDFNAIDKVTKKQTDDEPISTNLSKTSSTEKKKPTTKGSKTQEKVNAFISMLTNSTVTSSDSETAEDESIASWTDYYNEEEVEFLEGLDETERQSLIDLEQQIRDSKKPEMPVRFKILKSSLSEGAKYLVLNKLDQMDCFEDHKIQQWVDGLATIPFGKYVAPIVTLDQGRSAVFSFLKQANTFMNNSIFGHKEAKAQILEYIAQYISNPRSNGKCLALQGPPGNGKTTLVRNGIAKAIGRPFAQISLGGANDVSVLAGHDFTYEGSQCGRICTILRETGIMNPIIYFDELDKVSSTHKGDDIYNFLCHLTDFSQNNVYHDKYYDGIDLDLSKAIFIFSFNDITKINPILLDRLHVIQTKGFNTVEKSSIAKDYLIPELMKDIGLNPEDISFDDEVLVDIINTHCREEQGVRKLKRILEGMLTKLNILQFSKLEEESIDLPYDIPGLTFPLTINHKIVSKLVVEDSTCKPPHSMYL